MQFDNRVIRVPLGCCFCDVAILFSICDLLFAGLRSPIRIAAIGCRTFFGYPVGTHVCSLFIFHPFCANESVNSIYFALTFAGARALFTICR